MRPSVFPMAAAMLIALTGCSTGAQAVNTPADLQASVCDQGTYRDSDREEWFVEKAGKCQVDGQEVRLLTFANNEARDNFREVAEGFGGRYVEGERWLIEVPDQDVERTVAARV